MTNNKKPEHIYFPQPINVIPSVPTKYELHWHHFTELIFYPMNSHSTSVPKIIVDQVVYELHPGDTLLIWSSEMHSVESNGDNALLGIQFPSSLLTDLPEFASYSHLFRNYHLIRRDDGEMEFLAEYMHEKLHQIVSVRNAEAPFHGVEELICVYELFMQFGIFLQNSILPKDVAARQGNTRTIDKINAACRFIAENCDKDLTLDSIADQVGFSSCYFSRVFKQTIQCNFVEYLTLQRLKRAQNLLADTDDAITTIAMESGFKSISTFNRVFQKYKGCSPSEFKRHYLQ
ncbi:MAG: helix-turn-helix transcriptional regulator [Lachnospiraceae bacterium]|nr:helix-turn-helix transcriptional regulator [Lachnospiraceae bacterium]MBQ2100267.1 helix-turn-helix transcriptional regulator [Lachnospiraceae bacterium]MBQ3906605.1 helix-turn-helix transcriptional regulator [Lachnospiraceae bacterium]MCR4597643.1 AraC family transcriptional regulator [Acetatifactor sp.]